MSRPGCGFQNRARPTPAAPSPGRTPASPTIVRARGPVGSGRSGVGNALSGTDLVDLLLRVGGTFPATPGPNLPQLAKGLSANRAATPNCRRLTPTLGARADPHGSPRHRRPQTVAFARLKTCDAAGGLRPRQGLQTLSRGPSGTYQRQASAAVITTKFYRRTQAYYFWRHTLAPSREYVVS